MLEFKFDTQLLIEGHDLDEDAINDYFTEKVLDDRNVLLQSYDRQYEAETVAISDVGFLSRCVQVTFELQ